MKPYFAILIDSFNEAVASRMLWILFAAWTLILVGIAPFGYVEEKTFELRPQELKDATGFLKQLEAAREGKGSASQQRIASMLSEESVESIKSFNAKTEEEKRPVRRDAIKSLIDSLNEVLKKKDLYAADAWPTADKRSNMKDLISQGTENLGEDEVQELNRRLLENSYSAFIQPANGDGLWLGYAGFKLFDQLPVSRRQANQFVELFAFSAIIKIGLGVIAVFVAIIITSSLIPDMLQAGSLHLLLSKPISRALLFLSKFFGGSVFILLNITYLLIGLYFIAGWRFGIWNEGLLAIIPVITFVFIIFFSVSALAGVIWKNAIVSVVLTILFWLACFVVGAVRGGFQPWVERFPQVVNLSENQGELLASTEAGQLRVWNKDKADWEGAVSNDFDPGRKVVGPVFLADSKQVVFAEAGRGGMGFRGARGNLTIVDLQEETSEKEKEKAKPRDFRWDSEIGPEVPEGMRQVLPWRGTMLVLAESGIFRLDPKKLELAESVPTSFLGFSIPKVATVTPFEKVTSPTWSSERPDFMTITPDGNQVWLYHRGELEQLVWEEKSFESKQVAKLEGDKNLIGLVAVSASKGLLVRENELPKVFDLNKADVFQEVAGAKIEAPRQLWYLGESEQFVVVYQDGEVGLIDAATLKYTRPNLAGQGKASAVCVSEGGNLLVAHSVRSISKWDLKNSTVVDSKVSPRTTVQWIYDFIINPIYIVNPKPAALDETTAYLLQGTDTLGISLNTTDVEQSRDKIDPWTPLWTNAIFVVVMLTISCLYFVRQEF
jgi:WD40 repeat protein